MLDSLMTPERKLIFSRRNENRAVLRAWRRRTVLFFCKPRVPRHLPAGAPPLEPRLRGAASASARGEPPAGPYAFSFGGLPPKNCQSGSRETRDKFYFNDELLLFLSRSGTNSLCVASNFNRASRTPVGSHAAMEDRRDR